MADEIEVIAEIDEFEKAKLSVAKGEKRLTDVEQNISDIVEVIATIEGVTI